MTRRFIRLVPTLLIALAATGAAWTLYQRYLSVPWTRDGQVRANVVGVAPRISGPVIEIAVTDNQIVRKDDLLFVIDPADYQARVEIARSDVLNAEANVKQKEQDFERQSNLFQRKVNPLADFQTAQNSVSMAKAQLANAKATLDLAHLNLGYTRITAPVSGLVTNMNISPGAYVSAGQRLTALVDSTSYWIAAYFKETQLPAIHVGQKATVNLLGYGSTPLKGVVRSVGWGIYLQDGSSEAAGLLPAVNQTVDWVRLPQRFPVRIQVEPNPAVPLRIGQTVSVTMVDEPALKQPLAGGTVISHSPPLMIRSPR